MIEIPMVVLLILALLPGALILLIGPRASSGPDNKCVICRQTRCDEYCPNADDD